jgi:hypothetical protein
LFAKRISLGYDNAASMTKAYAYFLLILI